MPQGDYMAQPEDDFEAKIRQMTESLMTSCFTAIVDSNADFFASTADWFECLGPLYYVQVNVFKRQTGGGSIMTI
jgi:hypothetical protein